MKSKALIVSDRIKTLWVINLQRVKLPKLPSLIVKMTFSSKKTNDLSKIKVKNDFFSFFFFFWANHINQQRDKIIMIYNGLMTK